MAHSIAELGITAKANIHKMNALAVPRRRGKIEVPRPMAELSGSALRFLCGMYRLSRGGSKTELIQRILTSGYPIHDVLMRVQELGLCDRIVPFLHKEDLENRLEAVTLPVSGSRKEQVLRLIENRLFDARAILHDLSPMAITDLYHSTFGKVPTAPKGQAIEEIVASAGLVSGEDSARTTGEAATGVRFEHDIALSFAGEDRSVARGIGERLRQVGVRVFYDEFYKPELWGRNLSQEFRRRYGPSSRFVLPFISRHYAIKDWTDFEFTIAQEEARRRSREFILPVRLDDTVIVGLRSDVAYLDFRREEVDGIVSTILKKLGTRDGPGERSSEPSLNQSLEREPRPRAQSSPPMELVIEKTIVSRSFDIGGGRPATLKLPVGPGDYTFGSLEEEDRNWFSWYIVDVKNLRKMEQGRTFDYEAGEDSVQSAAMEWMVPSRGPWYLVLDMSMDQYVGRVTVNLKRRPPSATPAHESRG